MLSFVDHSRLQKRNCSLFFVLLRFPGKIIDYFRLIDIVVPALCNSRFSSLLFLVYLYAIIVFYCGYKLFKVRQQHNIITLLQRTRSILIAIYTYTREGERKKLLCVCVCVCAFLYCRKCLLSYINTRKMLII